MDNCGKNTLKVNIPYSQVEGKAAYDNSQGYTEIRG